MTEAAREQLKQVGRDLVKEIPATICAQLIGRGLSFAQAEAMLERAKDLLRDAII